MADPGSACSEMKHHRLTFEVQIICRVSCFLVTFRERDRNQIASVSNELLYKLSSKMGFFSLAQPYKTVREVEINFYCISISPY